MKRVFFVALTFTLSAYAQKADLTIVDPDIDSRPLRENYHIQEVTPAPHLLPSREERDGFLGSLRETKKWDELKKDLFFMDLKNKSVTDLKKDYPEFSEITLKRLKERRK